MRSSAAPSIRREGSIREAFARAGILACFVSSALACSAGVDDDEGGSSRDGGNGTGGSPAQGGGGSPGVGGQGAQGGVMFQGGGGSGDGGSIENPCGTECIDDELCEGIHRGLDNDCDGEVDEGCSCGIGESSSCFMGDPSYRDAIGCAPGTMQCAENGSWGPCIGGTHAIDMCFSSDPLGCHAINAVPFQTVDLRPGTGMFDDDADSDMFEVGCPVGVNPCPAVLNASDYQALQSGEYTVTYTKTVGAQMESCTYPLYVGARGLRVELSWNFPTNGQATDLDLHMHEPMTETGWGVNVPQDCDFANCKSYNFIFPGGTQPEWFPPGNTPPDPVNWYDDPDDQQDLCYYAPRGEGQAWQDAMMGCHSPRLDLDNISCDTTIDDPDDPSFCAPENINIDFPPKEQWIRVAIHYFPGTSTFPGQTYPNVKFFCDGRQAAELGSFGYGDPETPVVWSGATDQTKLWIVADVLFHEDECGETCIVSPIYADDVAKTPLIMLMSEAQANFTPPYPPLP